MLFSVVNRDPRRRRILTNSLLSLYPGCIVYELEELLDLVFCLREHAVEAVIWELADNDSQDLSHLHRIRVQHPEILFLVCAEDDTLLDEAMWNGASKYFINPLLPEQIAEAMDTRKKA